jgi:hypothetical protein
MDLFTFYNFFNVYGSEQAETEHEIIAFSGNYNPDATVRALWILAKRIQKQEKEIQELKARLEKI